MPEDRAAAAEECCKDNDLPFDAKHGSRCLGGFLGDKLIETDWTEEKVEA